MITITGLDDIRRFGFDALTGEACRVGTRILCDMTTEAEKILCDLFGMNYISFGKYAPFPPAWNSYGDRSFMLPYSLFPDLAAWCLIHHGCVEVMILRAGRNENYSWGNEIVGLERGDSRKQWQELTDLYNKIGKYHRILKIDSNQPGEGTRCTHQMSGRTE